MHTHTHANTHTLVTVTESAQFGIFRRTTSWSLLTDASPGAAVTRPKRCSDASPVNLNRQLEEAAKSKWIRYTADSA